MRKENINRIEDESAKDYVTYYDDRLAIIDSITNLKRYERKGEMKVDVSIALVCLKGTFSININGETRTVRDNDLLMCRPYIILGNVTSVSDVEFRCICLSPDYLKQMTLLSKATLDAQRTIEKNPILHLEQHEVSLFCQYYDLLRSRLTGTPYRHQREITDALLRAFMYEFHDMLERFITFKPRNYTAGENLFFSFTELISSSFPKNRSVAWYADQLHITPKYLSAISKETSGHTASEIINQYVVKDVEMLLKRTDLSIKEVANELDFPNLSFFGKYVKRYFGCSPREYREKNFNKQNK